MSAKFRTRASVMVAAMCRGWAGSTAFDSKACLGLGLGLDLHFAVLVSVYRVHSCCFFQHVVRERESMLWFGMLGWVRAASVSKSWEVPGNWPPCPEYKKNWRVFGPVVQLGFRIRRGLLQG